ncbi:MAG: sugar O-acetyltransferase [Clostridiales bacterium]|jgi:maltose O-acetyltransferase|nr:sugar O-acetyltransferase [Clostridiales bacterium]
MQKSEKEKMLSGEYYFAGDQVLAAERDYARSLIYEYNNTKPNEKEKRREILNRLIKAKGPLNIEPPFYCDYGNNIETGGNFYANFGCVILDVNKVIIGDNVLLGPNVQLYTAMHPPDPIKRLSGVENSKPIIIGNNVWIGGGAIVCPGVKIGDNVTIGAGSVVTKDMPSNVIAAGNPCRIVKVIQNRFH